MKKETYGSDAVQNYCNRLDNQFESILATTYVAWGIIMVVSIVAILWRVW